MCPVWQEEQVHEAGCGFCFPQRPLFPFAHMDQPASVFSLPPDFYSPGGAGGCVFGYQHPLWGENKVIPPGALFSR